MCSSDMKILDLFYFFSPHYNFPLETILFLCHFLFPQQVTSYKTALESGCWQISSALAFIFPGITADCDEESLRSNPEVVIPAAN